MNRSALSALFVAAVFAGGCTDVREEPANDVAGAYLRAAAHGDVERLCALRTDGSLRWWGGRRGCERRAKGIAVGPLPRTLDRRTRLGIQRKALDVDARTAQVLPADTTVQGEDARVVVDFGEAFLEDGHAVGGEIIEVDLKHAGDRYRIARVGFAVFAD